MNDLKRTTDTAPPDGRKDPGENPPNSMPDPKPKDYSDIKITTYKKAKSYGKLAAVAAVVAVLIIIFVL